MIPRETTEKFTTAATSWSQQILRVLLEWTIDKVLTLCRVHAVGWALRHASWWLLTRDGRHERKKINLIGCTTLLSFLDKNKMREIVWVLEETFEKLSVPAIADQFHLLTRTHASGAWCSARAGRRQRGRVLNPSLIPTNAGCLFDIPEPSQSIIELQGWLLGGRPQLVPSCHVTTYSVAMILEFDQRPAAYSLFLIFFFFPSRHAEQRSQEQ